MNMKENSTKSKKSSISEDEARRSSKVSAVEPSRKSKRISSAGGSGVRQSTMWRLSGKGFKTPKYQNTYRLEPYLPFRHEVSDKILYRVMNEILGDAEYSTMDGPNLCQTMATEVRDKLYKTDFDRVKYVVIMTIIENADQSMISMDSKLWDPTRDTYSLLVIRTLTYFAVGTVCALYYE